MHFELRLHLIWRSCLPRYNRIQMTDFCRSAGILVVIALTSPLYAAKKPVTIHDAFANPPQFHAPAPIWRPDGKAFVYQDHGKIWLYDIALRHASEWADLEELQKPYEKKPNGMPKPFDWRNRRVDTSGPQWFSDGSALFLPARHGSFILEPGKPKPREAFTDMTEKNVPTLSPDGHRILFRLNADLFVFDLQSRKTIRLTFNGSETLLNGELDWVYPEELDLGKAFWWSPDSKYIAYMQFNVGNEFIYPHEDLLGTRAVFEPQRYPQAGTPNAVVKIGVVPASGGATTWIDLGPDSSALLARVNWTPDSKRLAIQQMPRVQDKLDLLIADASSGRAKALLTEHDKTWVNVSDDLRLLKASPQFLWSSERSGYRHLYLYSMNGELARQLTSGNWQVNRVVALNEKSRYVYFTSTQAGQLEEQLYRVSLDGGTPERLTHGAGVHDIRSDEQGRNYLDTYSSLTSPPETLLCDSSGAHLAVIDQANRSALDAFDILPTEIVTLPASDGTLLYGRLVKPANFDPAKKYPAVVFVYGGPHAQSVRNSWTGLSWEQVLAHRGFVTWQLDNRGSAGRGHAFESPVYREFGKTELADQRAGVDKLVSMGFVNRDRIGMYGWSFGGYMTLYSLLHAPDVFKVGIAGAPVTDWHNYDTIYTERYMGVPDQNADGYRRSSNVQAAAELRSKLLIVCNFEDDNVLFQNTMQMMTALHKANKEFDFMLYPQKTHGVSGPMSEGMHQQMTDFLIKNLHP
jgi:dipeptidyl-peptidase-4